MREADVRKEWLDELPPAARAVAARIWWPPLEHPFFTEALDGLRKAFRGPPTRPVSTLTGVAGVGKTTLLDLLAAELDVKWGQLQLSNPAAHPVLRFKVRPATYFSFQHCFVEPALEELDSPRGSGKPVVPGPSVRVNHAATRRQSSSEALGALLGACDAYDVRVMLADEAHAFGMSRNDIEYMRSLESIKSLCDDAKVRLVLAGTFELRTVRDMSSQLTRRTHDVRLPRYHRDIEPEMEAFKAILGLLQERLPVDAPPLVEEWESLYEGSLGCVGIVVDWLVEAAVEAAMANAMKNLIGYLDDAQLSDEQRQRLRMDIADAENWTIEEWAAKREPPLVEASAEKEARRSPAPKKSTGSGAQAKARRSSAPKKGRRRGIRKPVRDAAFVVVGTRR